MVSTTFLYISVQLLALPLMATCLSGMSAFSDTGAVSSTVEQAQVSMPVAADGVVVAAEGSLPVLAADSATVDADGFTTVAPSSSMPQNSALKTVSLQKQYVPIKNKDNKTIAYKTAYFGTVYLGSPTPQEFTAVFDTGSGHLIVPSDRCPGEACLKHRRYSREQSSTAVEIEYDGKVITGDAPERDSVAIAFGTGQVLGEFVQERVCLGASSDHCTTLRVVVATEMTTDPFGLFAFDGVLGLGLEALTLDPAFSFFGQMAGQMEGAQPQFAVFLARDDVGENSITFGGYDPAKATSEIEWAPVAMKELGYWQVQIKSVRIGDHVLDECADGTCRAIVDTGTSLLSVPRAAARTMHRLLARAVPQEDYGDVSGIDCRRIPGQQLHFELVGGPVVTLDVEDYSRPTPFNMTMPNTTEAKLFCRSLLLPMDMKPPLGPKVFIWGEPVLRRYYTVFDIAEKQIGFSVAKQPEPETSEEVPRGLPAVGAPPPGSRVAGAPLRTTADRAEAEVTSV